MSKKLFLSIIILCSIILTSCATIIHGGSQKIIVNSQPNNAKVKIINQNGRGLLGTYSTPCVLRLERSNGYFQKAEYTLEFEKEGYEKQIISVEGSINGTYLIGNFFFGGLIGWLIVDPSTGAMWDLYPDDVYVELNKTVTDNIIITDTLNVIKNKSTQE